MGEEPKMTTFQDNMKRQISRAFTGENDE